MCEVNEMFETYTAYINFLIRQGYTLNEILEMTMRTIDEIASVIP